MDVPYTYVFGALLLIYMVYSQWAGLDSRYPIAAALVLLVGAAIVDASGASAVANTLSVFVFLLLAAGVVLLLADHVRASRRAARSGADATAAQPPEAAEEVQATSEDPLHGLEEQLVSRIHAARQQHRERKEARRRQHDHR